MVVLLHSGVGLNSTFQLLCRSGGCSVGETDNCAGLAGVSFKLLRVEAMAAVQDVVYLNCAGPSGPIPVCGWVVSTGGADVVIATASGILKGVEQVVQGKHSDIQIDFIKVPATSVTLSSPSTWEGPKPKDLPPLASCLEAWKKEQRTTCPAARPSFLRLPSPSVLEAVFVLE